MFFRPIPTLYNKNSIFMDKKTLTPAKWVFIIAMMAFLVASFIVGTIQSNSNSPTTTSDTSVVTSSTEPAASKATTTSISEQDQNNSSQITANDIAPYLSGVVEVLCKKRDANGIDQANDTGSGSLWSFSNGAYDVVTNEHVIAGDDLCVIWIPNSNGNQQGFYDLDLSSIKSWNSIADEAVVPILSVSEMRTRNSLNDVGIYDVPVSNLNYNISSLQECPSAMPANAPIAIVGYPAFSSINVQGNLYGAFKNQITTNGIISGNYSTYQNGGLPNTDYYISATIDSGNSGGVAFSKNMDGLCLLGIPTWITLTGNFTNEGVVQNINNIRVK
jgi:hypothetical protein